ncbi:MAG: glycosyltransferase family 4 protein, partial [Terriglobales bacterium]
GAAAPPRGRDERAGVVLAGPLLMISSVARINRYLAGALERDPSLALALDPTLAGEAPIAAFPHPAEWAAGLRRLPRRLDLTIRHGWPPDFTPPPAGRTALILPWEFGAIPRAWLPGLARAAEVWVPSAFVRDVLLTAGVEPGRIVVIPNGVNPELFCPEGASARPPAARGTTFLFAGGAIRRKGMDLLLSAWRAAFTARDEVTLVIKDLGSHSFYRHLSLAAEIAAAARDPRPAPIIYLNDACSEAEMAALYRGSDVLVLPYRGEGFGLPLAEALACGKPVITTAAGPAPEFCPLDAAWWVEAVARPVPVAMRPSGAMTGDLTWWEPSRAGLIAALRAAASASEAERRRKGAIGAAHMRQHYTWDAATGCYCERVTGLLGSGEPALGPIPLPVDAHGTPRTQGMALS